MSTSDRLAELRAPKGERNGTAALAFLPFKDLHFPLNNREYYLSRELAERGWNVFWALPQSSNNRGVTLHWPVLWLPDVDLRGRRYWFPFYLAVKLRMAGVRLLWLSGWAIRDLDQINWLIQVLKVAGVRVVYDPIDPICEYESAEAEEHAAVYHRCAAKARRVYSGADLVVAVTPEMKSLLVDSGAPPNRVVVGRWGTDESLFDPRAVKGDLKERLGLPADTFLAGWLGHMNPFKGLRDVILPLVEKASKTQQRIHFVVAGRGILEQEIREWAAERPDLALTILPSIDYRDAPGFTGSLDAYLVPTNPRSSYARAICPVKCFDALRLGTPLIVTATEATRFLAEYEDQVFLANFDADSFLEALVHLRNAGKRVISFEELERRTCSHQKVSLMLADAIAGLARGSFP